MRIGHRPHRAIGDLRNLVLAFAVGLFTALVTFHPADVAPQTTIRTEPIHNAMGPVGAHVAHFFCRRLDSGPSFCGIFTYLRLSYVIGRQSRITMVDVWGWFGIILSAVILLHLWMAPTQLLGNPPGGVGGEYITEIFKAFLSGPGTLLAGATLFIVSIVALSRRSVFELARLIARGGKNAYAYARGRGTAVDEDDTERSTADVGRSDSVDVGRNELEAPAETDDIEPKLEIKISERRQTTTETLEVAEKSPEKEPLLPPVQEESNSESEEPPPLEVAEADIVSEEVLESDSPESDEEDENLVIVESDAMKRSRTFVDQKVELESVSRQYEFEPQILDYRPPDDGSVDRDALTRNAQLRRLS